MAKLVRATAIGVRQETTQGTAIAPGATDFMLAEDVQIEPDFEVIERNYYRSNLDPVPASVGKQAYKVSFKTELKGSGTRGNSYMPLVAALDACGFDTVATPATSVVSTPVSAPASANFYGPGKSCSIEVYKDGIKHVVAGCIGNVKMTFPAGKIAMLAFEFKGVYAVPTDASPGTQTYLAQLPAIVQGASFAIHTFAAVIASMEIDLGNDVVERPSVNAATSLLGYMIAGRKPTLTIDPETDTLSNFNPFTKITAGTTGVVTITIGATSGNIVKVDCANAQFTGVKYADRNGILIYQPTIRLTGAGNDSVIITAT